MSKILMSLVLSLVSSSAFAQQSFREDPLGETWFQPEPNYHIGAEETGKKKTEKSWELLFNKAKALAGVRREKAEAEVSLTQKTAQKPILSETGSDLIDFSGTGRK